MKLSKTLAISIATLAVSAASASAAMMMPTQNCSYSFTQNLKMGSKGAEVMNLQKVLNMYPQTMVASTGAGSSGMETMKFGPATKRAVIKFQELNAADTLTPAGLSRGTGNVYGLTRAALNQICKGDVSTNTNGNPSNGNTGTVNTGAGVVSNNIPTSVLVQGQAGAKLAEFVVSANGTVSNVVLQRIGLANNSTLKNVYLYDGMTRLTDASSVRTDGSISFNSTAGLFSVNGTRTITVRADIPSGCTSTGVPTGCQNTSGQTIGVAFTSMTMMGSTAKSVAGATGALFAISSANTVTANFVNPPTPSATSYTASAPLAVNSGNVNQTLWSNNLSIGNNPALLKGATFKMIGSAPANTLSNVQLYVDGVSRGMASINQMNQYVFGFSAVTLTTGSHTFELRGDVIAGANRSFYMTVERGSDVIVEDSTLVGVAVSVSQSGNELINDNAGYIGVNTGTLTVNQDPAFSNTTNIVGGASQVKIGAWKITAYGEDVKVSNLNFNTLTGTGGLTVTSGGSGGQVTLANVGLYVNGGQVGSNANPVTIGVNAAGSVFSYTGLGSNVYIPAGQSVVVELKADIMNSSSVAYIAGTISSTLTLPTGSAQGISSSQTYPVASSIVVGGQTLTIGNNVAFGSTAGFSTSNKAPNTQSVKIGSFSIQAGSAEDLTINNVVVGLPTGAGNTMLASNQLTNLTVKDGSTVLGTPVGIPTASNNFSANLVVNKSSTKMLDVYADFGPGSSTFTVTPNIYVTYRGNTSNLTAYAPVTAPATSTVGSQTTAAVAVVIAAGVTLNGGQSPVSQLIIGNQSNFSIGTFNFKANTAVAGAVIKDITFTVLSNTIKTITINGQSATVIGTTATAYNVGAVVPADASGINLPVTVSVACVGTANGCAANSPLPATVQVSSFTYNDGVTVQSVTGVGAVTNSMSIVGSKPTLTVNSVQQTGLVLGQENKIGEVTVSADAAGQVKLNTLTFSLSSSGVTSPVFTGTQAGNMRVADGNSTISGTTCTNAGVCTMGGYTVSAGASKTFSLYAIVSGTPTASTVVSVSSSVTASGLSWDDSLGGGTAITGANVYNFPTNSYSIRQ